MTSPTQSRGVGALLFVVGLGLVRWTWGTVAATGGYSPAVAFLGPSLTLVGLGAVIHGPPLPATSGSVLNRYVWASVPVALVHVALVHYA